MTAPLPDGLEGSPWWLRATVRVGLPTVAAAVLMWFILLRTTAVLDRLALNDQTIVQNQQLIITTQREIVDLLREHEQTSDTMQRVVLCLSLAGTDRERSSCLSGAVQ